MTDLNKQLSKLKEQRKMLFRVCPLTESMPDFESKLHFFDSEIRKIKQQIARQQ